MKKVLFIFGMLLFVVNAFSQPNHLAYSSFVTSDTSTIISKISCVDSYGNVYVAGHIYSACLPTNEDSYDTTVSATIFGGQDIFLMQIKPNHEIGWCTYFGDTGWEEINSITCENDTLYLTMFTASHENIVTQNALYPNSPPPVPDTQTVFPFITTWSIYGELIYSSYLQNSLRCQQTSDRFFFKNGRYYITARHQWHYPSYFSGEMTAGLGDGYFAIFDEYGNFIYDRFLGGNKTEVLQDLVVDDNYIYCALRAYSDTSSIYPPDYLPSSNSNVVFVKIDQTTKNIEWTYAKNKPTGNSLEQDIFVDSNGKIYIFLSDCPTDFTPLYGQGGIQSPEITGNFLIELDPNGTPVWSSYLPTDMYYVEMLEVDYNGTLLLYSYINASPNSPQTVDNWGYETGPNQGYYILLTPEHNIAFASYLGGQDDYEPLTSCLFNNKLYAITSTNSSDLIITNELSPASPDPSSGKSIFMHIFDDAVNIEETADHQNALTVFPSPTSGSLSIQLPNTDTWIIHVFNSNGQLVSTENINQSNFIQLNIQNMNTGLYTVQAMNSDGIVYSEMVVKE